MTNATADVATSGKDDITAVEARRPGIVPEDLMPLLSLNEIVRRRNFLVQATKTVMVENTDYGVIPGTAGKAVLLKPGAEKLCSLFGLSPRIAEITAEEDWNGEKHGGETFLYYRVRIELTRNGILLAEGVASCNSYESKYRYRTGERKCPKCGKPAIIRGRAEYGGGWVCFSKKNGCNAKFKDGDPAIESQPAGRVLNPDVADLANTLLKMAHKRALLAAVLIATNASEFFAQDAEDLQMIDLPVAQSVRHAPAEPEPPREAKAGAPEGADATVSQEAPARPWKTFAGMINAFAGLRGRLGPDHDAVYGEVLGQFGVQHSNQFKDFRPAAAAYQLLLRRVLQLEAALNPGSDELDAAEMLEDRPPEEKVGI